MADRERPASRSREAGLFIILSDRSRIGFRGISPIIGVSCSLKPWQLRHQEDVEQGPASAPIPMMTLFAMLEGAPGTLIRAMEARMRIEERE